MSETKDQLVEQLGCYSGTILDINSDIIDTSLINFGNYDTWLQPSIRNPSEYSVHDLRAWLRADVEQDSHDNKKSIDTRTFTRPKKRSGRLSFESIVEMTASASPNVWKPQNLQSSEMQHADENYEEPLWQRRESVPSMLRPSNSEVGGPCSADTTLTSGQESLEAFLNMSQSKGIDSFINLAEPEFSDNVMNTSQPSFLYSSMMSITRDDLSQTINQSQIINQSQMINQSSVEDSQILTESMMQSSMFGDVADVNFNDTFAKNSANVTVLENTSFCSSDDRTFIAAPVKHLKEPLNGTFNMDATYTPNKFNAMLTNDLPNDPHASYIVNHKCQIPDTKLTVNDTSFVVRTEIADASFIIRKERDITEDATCKLDIPQHGSQNDTFNIQNFDATFEKTPSSSPRKSLINSTYKSQGASSNKLSMKLKVPKVSDRNDSFEVQNLDATFEKTSSTSPRKSSINSTFKAPTALSDKPSMYNHAINAKFKAPTHTKMDMTYEHNTEDYCNDVPLTNRYNTYRKASAPECARNENYPTNNLTTKLSNETVNIGASLDNLDATFNKPQQKIPRKLNAPRALSRLPQSLQKSNPNLISNSLKAVNTVGRTAIPSFGFNKLTRPNTARNVESSLTSKLYGLGKMKSGSEQRLEVTRNASDFQITRTGGSTESIDSTHSAHSAPDFDDRLSVCSDSSHTSYGMRTMNIEDLQKVNRMREDHVKPESTPKPSRRVLENTWVEAAKDLPSPILKNGPETFGSRGSSPRSTDSTVKTSSPLLSPAGSLQNLTINATESIKDINADETKLLVSRNEHIATKTISEATAKPVRSAGENRTGLRPPASWSSTNQRPASGIPRPASRIPAPRFVRPLTKINQGDIKK